MTARNKANRKKRGNVSAGHGRVGKHRCHPGGRGNAGGFHHVRTNFDKFHPGFFGKIGMRYFHKTNQKYYCPTINVDTLNSLIKDKQAVQEAAKEGKLPVIDCVEAGYFKVLGNGHISTPVIVKARFFSKLAERKIEKAGGICVPVA